ncbi:hypothetical protein AYI72_14285 [Shewanella algae]|nr:hypothetical protein AYI72_14285 [Shewanella algae]UYA16757.1 hypothetical protein D3X10_13435 [Shewanella algae]
MQDSNIGTGSNALWMYWLEACYHWKVLGRQGWSVRRHRRRLNNDESIGHRYLQETQESVWKTDNEKAAGKAVKKRRISTGKVA